MNKLLNLDRNASWGLFAEVKEEVASLGSLLNPSSVHADGQKARALVERAREEVSELLGLSPGDRIAFTSGASEANNAALLMPFWRSLAKAPAAGWGAQCIASAIEHPSVLGPVKRLAGFGLRTMLIAPGPDGEFRTSDFLSVAGPETRFVSVMLVNNETGQVLPVEEIASALKGLYPDLLVHTDAVQAPGKMEFSFRSLGVDMMSVSAHKMGGLSGAGALVIREGVDCEPLILGGAQESGRRAGTENVYGIVSFGAAARVVKRDLKSRIQRMRESRDLLEARLLSALPGSGVNCSKLERIPNTISIRVAGVHADDLVVGLDLEGIRISSGAACSSGKPEPSHALLAMGLATGAVQETVRISIGDDLSPEDLEHGAAVIISCASRLGARAA